MWNLQRIIIPWEGSRCMVEGKSTSLLRFWEHDYECEISRFQINYAYFIRIRIGKICFFIWNSFHNNMFVCQNDMEFCDIRIKIFYNHAFINKLMHSLIIRRTKRLKSTWVHKIQIFCLCQYLWQLVNPKLFIFKTSDVYLTGY